MEINIYISKKNFGGQPREMSRLLIYSPRSQRKRGFICESCNMGISRRVVPIPWVILWSCTWIGAYHLYHLFVLYEARQELKYNSQKFVQDALHEA